MSMTTHSADDPLLRPPEALIRGLAELGICHRPDAVEALYAPWQPAPPEGARCAQNLRYGPHARHVLDIYHPAPATPSKPGVLLYVHGGGFIRGDKSQRCNVGWWGAQQGHTTVLMNYRLAPEVRWPAGAEDVVSAVSWLRLHLSDLTGSSQPLLLIGESAGAAHAAGAALLRRLQPADWSLAGVALLSGPYDAGLEAAAPEALRIAQPDVRNEAYFGPDRTRWNEASVVRQIDAPPLPVLIAAAERDLLQMQVQAANLFTTLIREHDYQPELHWWRHHNHFSPGMSLGTADRTVSAPLEAFVARVTQGITR